MNMRFFKTYDRFPFRIINEIFELPSKVWNAFIALPIPTKNTDGLKIYLVWFSSTVWRGQFALTLFAQNPWKENITKYSYVIFTSLQFKIIYMSTSVPWLVGEALVEIESAVAKQTKKVQFCFFQNILPVTIFNHRQFSFGININFIYSSSP